MLGIREELLHPVMSHFPIALMTLALLTKIAQILALKFAQNQVKNLQLITRFLLFSAPVFFLMTMFLGDSSLDIIKNDFSELTLVYQHEELSYICLYFLLGSVVLEVLTMLEQIKLKFKPYIEFAIVVTLLVSNIYLFQAAHLGGQLVYDHGAAVKSK